MALLSGFDNVVVAAAAAASAAPVAVSPFPIRPTNFSNPSSHNPGITSLFFQASCSSCSSVTASLVICPAPSSTSSQASPASPLLTTSPFSSKTIPPFQTPLGPSSTIDSYSPPSPKTLPPNLSTPVLSLCLIFRSLKSPHNNPSSSPPEATLIILALKPTAPISSSRPPGVPELGRGRNGYSHKGARGTRPSRKATDSMRVRWYVDKIAPEQTAEASGCDSFKRRRSERRDSVSSSSLVEFPFSGKENE